MNVNHFQIGDRVKYVRVRPNWTIDSVGDEHIISDIHLEWALADDDTLQPYFEYATNIGAWYSHDDFELVAPATMESLLELRKDLSLEQEWEE